MVGTGKSGNPLRGYTVILTLEDRPEVYKYTLHRSWYTTTVTCWDKKSMKVFPVNGLEADDVLVVKDPNGEAFLCQLGSLVFKRSEITTETDTTISYARLLQ